jgi:hypothetical protein
MVGGDVRDRRAVFHGTRWIHPWCRTTSKYSCPAVDLTGNRPVRSTDDHWLLWRMKAWLEGRVSAGAVG